MKVTALFTNIDLKSLQATARTHFESVSGSGSQCNSKPGTPGGYITMTPPGRKLQRFQLEGEITASQVKALLEALKAESSALIEVNDATITGGEGGSILERPIEIQTLATAGSPVDSSHLLGFYLEYADAGGMGSIDVMATRIESEDDEESWALGFVIHEAASAE
ncbi:MAG: hypothetical protein VX913_08150 [Planctomycetota bacterium]|nr:hypothetical protein [Planctomycetota bacterium]